MLQSHQFMLNLLVFCREDCCFCDVCSNSDYCDCCCYCLYFYETCTHRHDGQVVVEMTSFLFLLKFFLRIRLGFVAIVVELLCRPRMLILFYFSSTKLKLHFLLVFHIMLMNLFVNFNASTPHFVPPI